MRCRTFVWIQLGLWVMLACLWPAVGHAKPAASAPSSASVAAQQGTQTHVQQVQAWEETLFTVRYDQDPLDARLSRLEATIFGASQTQLAVDARMAKLQDVLSVAKLGPLSEAAKAEARQMIQQARSNHAEPVGTNTQAPDASNPGIASQPAPGETDYPAVSQMERQLFNQSYEQEDITQRLARLEKQVFRTVQRGPLVNRVDNLRIMVMGPEDRPVVAATPASPQPQTGWYAHGTQAAPSSHPQQNPMINTTYQGPMNAPSSHPQQNPMINTTYQGPMNAPSPQAAPSAGAVYGPGTYPQVFPPGMGGGWGAPPPAAAPGYGYPAHQAAGLPSMGAPAAVTPDMLAAMTEIEKQILGPTYPQEALSTRLDRVESKVFGSASPELSPDERIQRITAVAAAGGAPMSPGAKAKSTFHNLLPILIQLLPLLLL